MRSVSLWLISIALAVSLDRVHRRQFRLARSLTTCYPITHIECSSVRCPDRYAETTGLLIGTAFHGDPEHAVDTGHG